MLRRNIQGQIARGINGACSGKPESRRDGDAENHADGQNCYQNEGDADLGAHDYGRGHERRCRGSGEELPETGLACQLVQILHKTDAHQQKADEQHGIMHEIGHSQRRRDLRQADLGFHHVRGQKGDEAGQHQKGAVVEHEHEIFPAFRHKFHDGRHAERLAPPDAQ